MNSPIKRCILADWIKGKIQLFFVYKRYTSLAKTQSNEREWMENSMQVSGNPKQAGATILINSK